MSRNEHLLDLADWYKEVGGGRLLQTPRMQLQLGTSERDLESILGLALPHKETSSTRFVSQIHMYPSQVARKLTWPYSKHRLCLKLYLNLAIIPV